MTESEKRAFLVDLLVCDFIVTPDKAQEETYRYVLKLLGINFATVANRAIDEAKRNAAQSKQTPKPPIAAKSSEQVRTTNARKGASNDGPIRRE